MGSKYKNFDMRSKSSGSLDESSKSGVKHYIVYLTAISAFLHVAVGGFVVAYSATTADGMKDTRSRIVATNEDITWIASIGAMSSIFGSCIAGFISDKMGRKTVIVFTSIPFVSSWLMVACGNNMTWIISGRFLNGFCVGVCGVTVSTYVAEISTPDTRGLIGAWFNSSFALGVLIANCLGSVLTWSWLAFFGACLAVFALFIFTFMPESPHWSINNGYYVDALNALKFLRRDHNVAEKEFQTLRTSIEEKVKTRLSIKDFLEPHLYKPTLLCIGLMFFQQFCGINALIAYTVNIFSRVAATLDPFIATIIVSVTQLLATFVSSYLMDKAGRKMLFFASGLLAFIGLTLVGCYDHLMKTGVISSTNYEWIPLFGFITFVIAFNLGFGPIPWVMAPEMVPTYARSTVVGITSVSAGLFMFIVMKTFYQMQNLLNDYGVYLLFGAISLMSCFFCYLLPETKGKSLEEIQMYFRKKKALF